jgi:serine/threonine protein kinase
MTGSSEVNVAELGLFGSYQLAYKVCTRRYFASYAAHTVDNYPGHDLLLHIYERTDPADLSIWLKDASAMRRLDHENLVPVLDAGAVQDRGYLVSPFTECRDLIDVWNRCGKRNIQFPINIAVYIARELCRGVIGVQEAIGELAYRAIPKAAIMIASSGVVMIDLGLASLQRRNGMGPYYALRYFSPEEVDGRPLSGRSSVYSVGIVLWELLTGKALFPRYSRLIPRRVVRDSDIKKRPFFSVVSPGAIRDRIPEELEAICCIALRTNPKRRFAGCEELGVELDGLLSARSDDGQALLGSLMKDLFELDFQQERVRRRAHRPKIEPTRPS